MEGRFRAAIPAAPDVELRRLFGCPAAFVNGNMFAGLHQDELILRLGRTDLEEARAAWGVGAVRARSGRAMREYLAPPAPVLEDLPALRAWLDRSLAYVRSLPPKA
ncbi:MAG TPA: TfoX/Sxy family protein [Paracoccaceae bacterium]|nr:TfoX/Sxy family protein [Paracoccaceae bacterium]